MGPKAAAKLKKSISFLFVFSGFFLFFLAMNFIDPKIEAYCSAHTSETSDLLNQLVRETHLKCLYPQMLSGKMQGQFLTFICQMLNPKSVLEIGTFTGYATICMAKGMADDAKIYTLELDEQLGEISQKYFKNAKLEFKIKQYFGNALEIIPDLDLQFELVFIDAAKMFYSDFYDLIFDKIPLGGFILADNALWSGKVLDAEAKDKQSMGIKKFNEKIQKDKRVRNLLLPLRDGIMVLRKESH